MTKNIYFFIVLIVVVILIGCGRDSSSATDDITVAEEALNRNDYETARSLCEGLEHANSDSAAMSVNDLCRMSMLYMLMSDIDQADDNTLTATRYYDRAMAMNADSASAFYNRVDANRSAHVQIMARLSHILGGHSTIYLDEDSIAIDSIDFDNPENAL